VKGTGNERKHTYPPPTFNLIAALLAVTFAAAALLALVIAAPVAAQTTITAPGLTGQAACGAGYSEAQLAAFDSSSNQFNATNTSVNFKLSSLVNWNGLRGLVGAGDNPVTSITVYGKVKNTRTGADVRMIDFGAATSTQNPSYSDNNVTLTETTPYVLILYSNFAGSGESNPFGVQCFMTGGTYTPANTNFGPSSTGCFTITPRTQLDIRNCLCGRSDLSQTATTIQPGHTHEQARGRLGCR